MTLPAQDGYVILDSDLQTGQLKLTDQVRSLFFPDWFRAAMEKGSTPEELQEFERIYWQQIAVQLQKISASPENWTYRGVPVGVSKAKFGKTSIPVKEVLLVSAAYTLPIFLAVSALVTGPASLVLAAKATAAIGPATAKLYSAINTYTPTELDVHTAVVAAMYRSSSKTLKGDGATVDEIRESFDLHPDLEKPRNLEAVLSDMASDKKKMLIRSIAGGVEVFKPNTF